MIIIVGTKLDSIACCTIFSLLRLSLVPCVQYFYSVSITFLFLASIHAQWGSEIKTSWKKQKSELNIVMNECISSLSYSYCPPPKQIITNQTDSLLVFSHVYSVFRIVRSQSLLQPRPSDEFSFCFWICSLTSAGQLMMATQCRQPIGASRLLDICGLQR